MEKFSPNSADSLEGDSPDLVQPPRTEADLDAKYLIKQPKSLASKIGAGILGAVSLFGGSQEAMAGGGLSPSPEKNRKLKKHFQISKLAINRSLGRM